MSRTVYGPRPAARATRRRCRYGCGAQVYAYTTETGFFIQIDAEPLPATTDRTHPWVAHRLCTYRGKWVGWVALMLPPRDPQMIVHTEHDCDKTPAAKRPRRG